MGLPVPAVTAWDVDGEAMITSAFAPEDLQQLWAPAPLSFANVDLYGEPGELARTPTENAVTYQVRYRIHGAADWTGTPYPSFGHGLAANYAELVRRVGTPTTWGAETVDTTVTRPDGVDLEGPIQVFVTPMSAESGPLARCVVTVTIPRGCLVEVP